MSSGTAAAGSMVKGVATYGIVRCGVGNPGGGNKGGGRRFSSSPGDLEGRNRNNGSKPLNRKLM